MPLLPWSEALELGLPQMDGTHHEFIGLLATAESASDAELSLAWHALVEHTESHFAQEDAAMRVAEGLPSGHCHMVQHHVVLQALREGAASAAAGDLAPIRMMIPELAVWFVRHVQTMDAALALHLRSGTSAGQAC